jgi:hypothetical protein
MVRPPPYAHYGWTMWWSPRTNRLPGPVLSALGLARGERVLATAPTAGGSYTVATLAALHLPDGTGGFVRLPWERVEHATWKDGVLHVREPGSGPEHHVRLTDPGAVPETVQERVTATIVISHHARLPGGGGVRIVGRRPLTAGPPGLASVGGDPRMAELIWTFVFDAGLDPADPGLRAQAEQILENLRRQTGL